MHTVASVMTRDIFGVAPDTSIETAARLLASKHIGGLPVVTPSGKPIGVVSLFDLVDPDRARTQRNGHPLFYKLGNGRPETIGDDVQLTDGCVADVMSPFVLSIESAAPLSAAAKLMVDENVHRLLVMDGGRLVGIVTTMDLLRGFVGATA
jgi:CBS domain-containing protein